MTDEVAGNLTPRVPSDVVLDLGNGETWTIRKGNANAEDSIAAMVALARMAKKGLMSDAAIKVAMQALEDNLKTVGALGDIRKFWTESTDLTVDQKLDVLRRAGIVIKDEFRDVFDYSVGGHQPVPYPLRNLDSLFAKRTVDRTTFDAEFAAWLDTLPVSDAGAHQFGQQQWVTFTNTAEARAALLPIQQQLMIQDGVTPNVTWDALDGREVVMRVFRNESGKLLGLAYANVDDLMAEATLRFSNSPSDAAFADWDKQAEPLLIQAVRTSEMFQTKLQQTMSDSSTWWEAFKAQMERAANDIKHILAMLPNR